jgi:hypothetical protein
LFLFKKSRIGNGSKGFSSFMTNHDISIYLKQIDENRDCFRLAQLTKHIANFVAKKRTIVRQAEHEGV